MYTSHYIRIKPTINGISLHILNDTYMHSIQTDKLYIPDLPIESKRSHIFPNLTYAVIVSIVHQCDHRCTTKLNIIHITIKRNNTVIFHGKRKHKMLCGISKKMMAFHLRQYYRTKKIKLFMQIQLCILQDLSLKSASGELFLKY